MKGKMMDKAALGKLLAKARNEALEEAAKIADRQAWAHGGQWFNGPELNSAAIAKGIRALIAQTEAK